MQIRRYIFILLSFGNIWLPVVIKDHEKALAFFGVTKKFAGQITQVTFIVYVLIGLVAIVAHLSLNEQARTIENYVVMPLIIGIAYLGNKLIVFAFRNKS